jgi:hypothetical protein
LIRLNNMSIEERVAKLEVQSEQNTEMLKDIDAKLTALSDQFLRHKGFMGGVIFTVSALWAVILVGVDFLWRR